jgi:hypothetical protein
MDINFNDAIDAAKEQFPDLMAPYDATNSEASLGLILDGVLENGDSREDAIDMAVDDVDEYDYNAPTATLYLLALIWYNVRKKFAKDERSFV